MRIGRVMRLLPVITDVALNARVRRGAPLALPQVLFNCSPVKYKRDIMTLHCRVVSEDGICLLPSFSIEDSEKEKAKEGHL